MLVVSAHADSVERGGSGVAQESYMGAATRRDGDDRERRVQATDEAPSRLICRSSIAGEASLSGQGATQHNSVGPRSKRKAADLAH